jgi:predicted enzyme related to lactoylglutathione lyase
MVEIHAYIEVERAEDGARFYCDAVGLTVARRLTPKWIELGGAAIPVFILGDRPEPREYTRHWTPVHLDFIVSDLATAVSRARSAGAVIEKEVEHEPFYMANCADPWGNGFDLIQMRGEGYAML